MIKSYDVSKVILGNNLSFSGCQICQEEIGSIELFVEIYLVQLKYKKCHAKAFDRERSVTQNEVKDYAASLAIW